MSVKVHAVLSRKGAIFLSGEKVHIQVSFKNCNTSESKSIAWACVQLHCEENPTAKAIFEDNDRSRGAHQPSTAVPKSKHAIFSSEPTILFCDISLEPGRSQKFECFHQIPLNAPPSFRGHFLKYFWFLSVAAQQVDVPLKMVQLPIKVLNVNISVDAADKQQSTTALSPTQNSFPSKEATTSSTFIEIAMNRIEEICSIRKKRIYEIHSGGVVFARIVLYKNTFKLGDDVIGKLEFPQENVYCLQTLVRMETVENLLDDIFSPSTESVNTHNTEHMITAFVKETYFKIQLPIAVAPSFTTEFVKVRWRLHFEFVTTDQKLMVQTSPELSKLSEELDIQTMKWDLPINVLTCNPFNAALICAVQSETSFTI